MRSHRLSVCDILRATDPAILHAAGLKLVNSGEKMRIFDDFPALLPLNSLSVLISSFKHMLSDISIDTITQTEMGLKLGNKNDERRIVDWEKRIIHIVHDELLDSDYSIKKDIRCLFNWDTLTKDQVYSVVCSFVGAVNQMVICQLDNQSPEIVSVVLDFISTHYGEWIQESFDAQYAKNKAKPSPFHASSPYSHCEVGVGLGILALGLVGAGIYVTANPRLSKMHSEPNHEEKEQKSSQAKKNQF